MVNRWNTYSMRSIRRRLPLPCVEVQVSHQLGVTTRRFHGFTWSHALRRAHKWLSTR